MFSIRRRKLLLVLVLIVLTMAVYFKFAIMDRGRRGTFTRMNLEPEISPAVDKYIRQLEAEDTSSNNTFMDTSLADDLKNKVRILCLILTTKDYYRTRARVVNATWARRCNNYYFILTSDMKSPLSHAIITPFEDTRENLIFKVQNAFQFAYANLIDQFDWILKADDDTYVIMENLRYLLSNYDSNKPGYLGFHFNNYLRNYGYMSGGAGYVISNNALRRLVEFGLNVPGACPISKSYYFPEVSEDFEIGKCLKASGVNVLNSLDTLNRETFHPYPLSTYLLQKLPEYVIEWANNNQETGIGCCSEYSISFHYMKPGTMLLVDQLLYHTSVHGRDTNRNQSGRDVFSIGRVTNMAKPSIELQEKTAAPASATSKGTTVSVNKSQA